MSQKSGLDYNSGGGLPYKGGEEAPSDTLNYANKHKLPHSHDSSGVGGHGLRAPDRRVNVTLPVSMAGQDIYLFWLVRCVCEVKLRVRAHMEPQCSRLAQVFSLFL